MSSGDWTQAVVSLEAVPLAVANADTPNASNEALALDKALVLLLLLSFRLKETIKFSSSLDKLCVSPSTGDTDGDGDIDTADLLFLLGAWGTPDGDVDGDGDTNTADLLALLGAWGECP